MNILCSFQALAEKRKLQTSLTAAETELSERSQELASVTESNKQLTIQMDTMNTEIEAVRNGCVSGQ